MSNARDEPPDPRIGYFYNVVGLHKQCVAQIDAGDIDIDDWVYRSRNACSDFLDEMADIGLHYQFRRSRRGLRWLYKMVSTVQS